ncbi:MAG: hypothetical protein ACI9OE_001945 [Mariniflexile sp.]|jgi:hypothetical protein
MKYTFLTVLFLFFHITHLQAQESISAKLIDTSTKKTIPFASISLNNKSGVISNENGEFQIQLNGNTTEKDSLFISCLGYEPKQIKVEKFKDSLIYLNPKSIELDEVLVLNKTYTVEEIIEKANENLTKNYAFTFNKKKLFYRESYFTDILKNNIKVEESTIPELNQKFVDSILMLMPKKADNYTEVLGELYSKTDTENNQKLDIIKASNLYDKSKEVTFEGLEEKFNAILKKHIKRDSYFKIKSGIFGTKQSLDSSFYNKSEEKENETQAFLETKKKEEQERKNNFLKYRKQTISNLEKSSFVFENSHLNFLDKSRKYHFKILDYIFLNDNFAYKIAFTPKRGADYEGILYINTDDFAIIRVDFENVKDIKSFSLLGLSFNENLHKGTFIYSKNSENTYSLKYAETELGSRFGIKRPLTIIEKNKHTKGRRKQNEISTEIHFIISNVVKKELVVFENKIINESIFNNFEEKASTEPTYLPKYDPDFWKGHNVIEPNQAIKSFKSIE